MWGKLVGGVCLGVILKQIITVLFSMNTFQKVFNHSPGPCKQLPGVVRGAEDAHVLPNGFLYISSGLNSLGIPDYPPGKLLWFDFNSGVDNAEEFRIEGGFDGSSMSPHGLSAWQDPKTGEVTLFVINHSKDGEKVELFRHDGASKTLKYVKSIRDPEFTALNDVVATGPDSFYATRIFTYSIFLEFFLMYPGGGVVLYDKGKTTVFGPGIRMPNGINISPDKQYLYVVESGTRKIITYKIQADKTIRRVQEYDTGSGPDNIHVDPSTGELWVGSHPNTYLVMLNMFFPDWKVKLYSQVLRMKVEEGKITDVREVYADDGTHLMGSSVAVPYNNRLYIASYINTALVCELTYPG